METKICKQCYKEFVKKPKLSKKEWFNRKFCCKKCLDNSKKGKPMSEETKIKMRGRIPWNKGIKGFIPWNKNIKYNEIQKSKLNIEGLKFGHAWNKDTKGICKKNSGSFTTENTTGDKNWNWNGGSSKKPYSIDWKKSLRIAIRERDNYLCKLCGEKQSDRAFSIHHIDYDKLNCNSDNLITLCNKCHAKTNFNREYWSEYFYNLIQTLCL